MNLYVIATPIGNLEDISFRAVRILKEVDFIVAEDTRHSQKLLKHYDINVPLISYHSHSDKTKVDKIISILKSGKNLALISDAGTPGISDPAWTLTQEALRQEINLIPIPGPSALITALMCAGIPINEFVYLGFVPAKKGRKTLFDSLIEEKRTVVLYESPHRIKKTLSQLMESVGEDRVIVLARELTKLHEEFHRGKISEILSDIEKKTPKGEMVLLVAPKNFR